MSLSLIEKELMVFKGRFKLKENGRMYEYGRLSCVVPRELIGKKVKVIIVPKENVREFEDKNLKVLIIEKK